METSYDLIETHCFSINKTENFLKNARFKNKNLQVTFTTYLLVLFILLVKISNVSKKLLSLGFLIIFLTLTPVLFGFWLIFMCYRQMVKLILKMKLGVKFGGLLDGTDAVWAIEEQSKSIINILMVIQSEEDAKEFYCHVKQSLENKIFKQKMRLSKISSTFHQAFGYFYLIKDDVQLDDCLRSLEITSGRKLMQILSDYSNVDLPKGHTAFWEILLGDQKIDWNNDEDKKFYPVIFRVHHSLADGVSLLKLLIEVFADSPEMIFRPNKKKMNLMKKLKTYTKNALEIFSVPSVIFQQNLRRPDCNELHGPVLSGQNILTVKVEDAQLIIGIIKKIKSLTRCTFSDILLTAVSSSFREYFKKNSSKMPSFLTTVALAYPDSSMNSSLTLENKFSLALLNLPIDTRTKPSFLSTLKRVQKETNSLRNSADYKVNYWFLKIAAALIPVPLLRFLLKSSQPTLIISNLPGPPSVNMFDGCRLQDLIFWVPHRGSTGVGVSVLSYDGRLQLGLNIDRALVSNDSDAEEIISGIYRNLIMMYNEIVEEKKGVK